MFLFVLILPPSKQIDFIMILKANTLYKVVFVFFCLSFSYTYATKENIHKDKEPEKDNRTWFSRNTGILVCGTGVLLSTLILYYKINDLNNKVKFLSDNQPNTQQISNLRNQGTRLSNRVSSVENRVSTIENRIYEFDKLYRYAKKKLPNKF